LDVKHPSIADSSDVWGWELAKTLSSLRYMKIERIRAKKSSVKLTAKVRNNMVADS
jgi:hypothetical protein